MLAHRRIHTLIIASAVLLIAGCAPMPIPTAPAPQSATPVSPARAATLAPTSVLATQAPVAAPPSTAATTVTSSAVQGDPAAGAKLFSTLPCSSCHDVTKPFPGGEICPNLGNIATEAERVLTAPDYHGKATNAAEYIRESILDPNAYIVAGDNYMNAEGQSVMPKNFATTLTPTQIDDLVAYLMTQ